MDIWNRPTASVENDLRLGLGLSCASLVAVLWVKTWCLVAWKAARALGLAGASGGGGYGVRNTAASLLLNTACRLAGPGAQCNVRGSLRAAREELGWCRSYCGRAHVVRDFGVKASNELYAGSPVCCAGPSPAVHGACARLLWWRYVPWTGPGLHRGSRRAAAASCLTSTLGQVPCGRVGVFAVAATGAKPRLSGQMAPAMCACPPQTCVW